MTAVFYIAAGLVIWCWLAVVVAVLMAQLRKVIGRWQARRHPAETTEMQTHEVSIADPEDLRAFLQDPNIPPLVKGIVTQVAHDAGLCGCDVFDQAGKLKQTDLEWLQSQRGGRS